jgi:ABC-type multidrug transport system ATPase subunit/peptidoglycan/LPS O-acetylase OafA/YrhL
MSTSTERLHALDAVRAFALLLGVVFHAGFSFIPGLIPGLWAMTDNSPSSTIGVLLFTAHIFRMSLFFFVAGFFARLLFHRGGARGFWANRSKRILVPLVAGWPIIFPLTAAVWVWGLTRTFAGTLPAAPANAPAPPPGAFPWTHLWFLYYLLVLYAIVLTVRAASVAIDRGGSLRRAADASVRWLVHTGAAAIAIALPVALALFVRRDWIAWFGIPTPDHSVIPELASLIGYGTALSFGWLIHRQSDLLNVWGRQWTWHLAGALAGTGACLSVAGIAPAFVPIAGGGVKLAFALAYSISIWCWSFAILGLATRFLSQANPTIRYMADASYWIYLVHLPVVCALQVAVGRLPLPWAIKFPLILIVALAVLFASYRYLVRSTFIGQLLNGRKYPRSVARVPPKDSGDPHPPDITTSQQAPLAMLTGVHKRYGKTLALAGLDLDVRPGELLAVLGPNGAGKSTAISLWLGLLEPDDGTVALLGGSPLDVESRRHVGVMMQEVGLTPELRVRELIDLTSSYYPKPLSTAQTLELTGTGAVADRPYARLSTGQKRQVQFALAICGRPRLLFLDEPTVGLDVEARATMWRAIRTMIGEGCSIVLTTHYLEEAEALADRVAVLAAGRLVACGSVNQIRSVVSRKQITCSTTLPEDQIRAWPDVVGVRADAGRVEITVVESEDVLRRLLASDQSVRDLEVRRAGLAEAFIEITREAA